MHPADRRALELIDGGAFREGDAGLLKARAASVPFYPGLVDVRPHEIGLSYQGQTLRSRREDSLTVHLIRRVLVQREWAPGTTKSQYLADLRRAIRDSHTKVVVYKRRGGSITGFWGPNTVPEHRHGEGADVNIFVVYAIALGVIITGYQEGNVDRLGIPKEARWLP